MLIRHGGESDSGPKARLKAGSPAGLPAPQARMASVATLSFHDARECVIDRVSAVRTAPAIDEVGLDCAAGRVLAREARADRDYPAVARAVRDGFAVRGGDTSGWLRGIRR